MRSEKIKAKETAHRQSSIDRLYEAVKAAKNLWTSKMIEISKDVYLMGRVWCYHFQFLSFKLFAFPWIPLPLPLISANRQILITWQSSGSVLIHFQLSNDLPENEMKAVLVNLINT